ncbi:MAG: hypothetical protein HUU46_23815 [Candidatus Hydrogenedentes bacterium]|nr:hypothetical protein [Candidatus Hydrogenedentota bacterium]
MEPTQNPEFKIQDSNVGLCATCVHGRIVPHPRGGDAYWRCGKHDEDKAFAKYPRLPVNSCAGYRPDDGLPDASSG